MNIIKILHPAKNLILKKSKLTIFLVILILLFGGFIYFQQSKSKVDIQFTQVKKQDLRTEVSSSGILTGKQTSDLKFLISGKVNFINVNIGDSVTKGQLLSGLDTTELSITLQQARNTLRDKQATVEKIEDDVKDHKTDENFTQKQTRTSAQVARDNAFDSVKAAERDLQDAYLVSPLEGIITQVNKSAGQFVSSADTVLQIVDSSKIYFDAEVDEADIDKIEVGQKALVTLNSNPQKEIEGSVSQIYPNTKTTSSGATVVIVRIDLTDSEISFINNLNGQVSIILSEARGALSIPQEALLDGRSVLVKIGNTFKQLKVKTGLNSDTDVEILDGLSEGQTIILNPQVVKNFKKN